MRRTKEKKQPTMLLAMLLAMVMTLSFLPISAFAAEGEAVTNGLVSETGGANDFRLAGNAAATLWMDADESAPVRRVAEDFKADVNRVTGLTPVISNAAERPQGAAVIFGTLDDSGMIKDLIESGKITQDEVTAIEGQWEAYLIKVIDAETLVVAGADPRGAVFGLYEISEQMGVSPWYYFADVAVNQKESVYIPAGTSLTDMPDVAYRGIFLNDEEKLSRWASNVMGDPNTMGPETYGKIFELILRLKGNYIWAAMHVNSFNNIQGNIDLIQEYGVVLGSSHCDMLLRTNVHEWDNWKARADIREKFGTNIQYDYTVSKDAVLEYWRENVIRHKDTEAQWTLGMRGAHDEPFNTANINQPAYASYGADEATRKANLLNEIIREQQDILLKELGQEKYDKSFQAMIPYKEVLPIYNHPAFDLPENVAVIWCDDNHSIMRRMPDEVERVREGGHGIYYHVSYWAPADQSYMWLSSAPLSLIGSELDKSWENNIRRAWVLNVGDIKPQETEMSFFIRYGWDVEEYKNNADKFVEDFMGNQFGDEYAEEIADIQTAFYKHTNVRKLDHMRVNLFD
ncbi:MAG: glycosyl hydrolase 115 family protein, partial [Clostridiales bacterium]|nr:glycosyl hydrolase 115 family protein [Clostridiales bacterium]